MLNGVQVDLNHVPLYVQNIIPVKMQLEQKGKLKKLQNHIANFRREKLSRSYDSDWPANIVVTVDRREYAYTRPRMETGEWGSPNSDTEPGSGQ